MTPAPPQGLPPMPAQGGGNPSGRTASLADLAGPMGPQTPLTTGPTPQQRVQAYMDQIRQVHSMIDALATDHPEASEDLNNAKTSLTNSMTKVAGAMTAPDNAAQPMTF
jgi:hypothetical protein